MLKLIDLKLAFLPISPLFTTTTISAMNTLPGIVSIKYTSCQNLQPHVMAQSISGAVIDINAPLTDIPFINIPECKWSGNLEQGARVEESTLEFTTTHHLPEGRRLAFIITVASGKQYLIGSREPKYPRITYSDTSGSPSGDAAVRSYKISHTALKSVLPCIL